MQIYNITIVHNDASYTGTRAEGDSITAAHERVKEYVRRGLMRNQTWDKPVVAAFIYNSRLNRLWQLGYNEQGKLIKA